MLAMAGMTAIIFAGVYDVQLPGGTAFHLAHPIRLASNGSNNTLALGGDETAPVVPRIPFAPIDPQRLNVEAALDRLHQNVPDNLYPYFDVFLYVSKAAQGSLAQHMYIFHKEASGDVAFEQSFAVSTGRERYERYFTSTPVGMFELDPNRFERNHYSRTWHAQMPWAMFLNATIHGRQTGIALHSAGEHVAALGNRASGGCVRLPPEKAAELFERFQKEERGNVPLFAYDPQERRTNKFGQLARDANGQPVLQYGYKVLLIIEDYNGGPPTVAAIV